MKTYAIELMCCLVIILTLEAVRTLAQDETRELAVSIPAPFQAVILPFPLPTNPASSKSTLCRLPTRQQIVVPFSGMPEWMMRRITWVRAYQKNRRLCCQQEISLFALHSCINGYRRDALNKYCAQEIEDDGRGLRAHPCCFSLSSQRYTCFERYFSDVIKPKLLMDEGFVANGTSMHRSVREEATRTEGQTVATTTTAAPPQSGNITASVLSSLVPYPLDCVLSQEKVDGMCRSLRQQNSRDLIASNQRPTASGNKQFKSSRKWAKFERNARLCCTLRSTARLRCFIAKKRQRFQDARCETSNHTCCRHEGLKRYRCFEFHNHNFSRSAGRTYHKRRGEPIVVVREEDDIRVAEEVDFEDREGRNFTDDVRSFNSTETEIVEESFSEEQIVEGELPAQTTPSDKLSTKKQKVAQIQPSRFVRDSCCHVGTLVRRYYTTNPCRRGLHFLRSKLKDQKTLSKICRRNYLLCCRA